MTRIRVPGVRASLLLLVLLAGLPGMGLTLWTGVSQRHTAAALVQADAKALVDRLSADEQRPFQETLEVLSLVAGRWEVRQSDPFICSSYLAGVLKRYPRYYNFGVATLDGDVYCNALTLTSTVNVTDRSYFREVLRTRGFAVGDYQIGRITGKPAVNAGFPVLDAAGRLHGVVFAAMSLAWLNHLSAQASLPVGAVLTVIDSKGVILARSPDPERWVGRALPEAPLVRTIMERGGQGTTEAGGLDGVRRLYAFAPLSPAVPGSPYLSIGVPASIAYGAVNRLLFADLVGLSLVILLGLGAAWWGGDLLLVRRLNALVGATDRLAAGDLQARTGLPHEGGELSHLARAFDEMAGALQAREVEARRAEARFRGLFEGVPIGLYRATPEGQVLDANTALVHMLGYPDRETLLTMRAEPVYVRPEDRSAWKERVEREGVARGVEIELRRADGTPIWVADTARTIRDKQGRVLYYEGSLEDITERKRAEEGLKQSEQRFRRLAENAHDLIFRFRVAPPRGFEYVSPAAAAVTGYTPEEFYADPDLGVKIVHPEDRAALHAATGNPAAHPTPIRLRLRRKDGSVVWISQRAVTVCDEAGTVIAFEGIVRDVTDLLQAAEEIRALNAQLEQRVAERTAELREAKAFLEHLIATSPGILFQVDARDLSVTYVSPNVERLLGYRAEEVLRNPAGLAAQVHPDDRAEFLSPESVQVRREGRPDLAGREIEIAREMRWLHKDGGYRWFSVAMRITHDERGRPRFTLGHALDITARKSAEEAMLQARADAERANLAKGEFLSRMSHELRTPLNAILGFAQLLQLDSLNPDQQESVDQILHGGRHLLDLINEVLDVTRLESGAPLPLSPEPVIVGEVVQECVDLIAPMAAAKQIQVQAQGVQASEQAVLADRQRLKQVLLNLLSNAVKYNRNGGSVSIALAPAAAGRARILVTDTGPGIPEDRQALLFRPFERLQAAQLGVEGTGLGLALSKRLIEAMGGVIGVESAAGTGSTFWVELPVAEIADIPAPPDVPAGEVAVPARTILYIEDNLASVRLIERILAHRSGVRLLTAMQGRLGLELIREHRPDLVLLDVHLSDLRGDELLRILRDDPRTSWIPVVVISATTDPRAHDQLLAAGARACLTKPLDAQRLLGLLDEVIRVEEPARDTGRV